MPPTSSGARTLLSNHWCNGTSVCNCRSAGSSATATREPTGGVELGCQVRIERTSDRSAPSAPILRIFRLVFLTRLRPVKLGHLGNLGHWSDVPFLLLW